MITIKEYAETHGKSVQSVYKQIKSEKNASDLDGHIHIEKINNQRVKMLDDVAVKILENASKKSVQVVMQNDDKERIEQLEQENKNLLIQIASIQQELIATQKELSIEKDNVKLLQQEKIALIESKNEEIEEPKEKESFWKRIFG